MTPIGTLAWDVDQAALVAISTTECRQYHLGHQPQREHQYHHQVIVLDFFDGQIFVAMAMVFPPKRCDANFVGHTLPSLLMLFSARLSLKMFFCCIDISAFKFPPSLTCTYAQNTRAAARIESKSSRKRIFFIFSACVSTKL